METLTGEENEWWVGGRVWVDVVADGAGIEIISNGNPLAKGTVRGDRGEVVFFGGRPFIPTCTLEFCLTIDNGKEKSIRIPLSQIRGETVRTPLPAEETHILVTRVEQVSTPRTLQSGSYNIGNNVIIALPDGRLVLRWCSAQ